MTKRFSWLLNRFLRVADTRQDVGEQAIIVAYQLTSEYYLRDICVWIDTRYCCWKGRDGGASMLAVLRQPIHVLPGVKQLGKPRLEIRPSFPFTSPTPRQF